MRKGVIWGAGILVLLGALFLGWKENVSNSPSIPGTETVRTGPGKKLPTPTGPRIAASANQAEALIAGAGRESLKRQAPVRPATPEALWKQEESLEDDPDYRERLVLTALHSPDPEEREEAVNALGFLDPSPEIVAACVHGLDDSVEEVRLEAALALSTLEDPSAVPALLRAFQKEQSSEVKEAIQEALDELGEAASEG